MGGLARSAAMEEAAAMPQPVPVLAELMVAAKAEAAAERWRGEVEVAAEVGGGDSCIRTRGVVGGALTVDGGVIVARRGMGAGGVAD